MDQETVRESLMPKPKNTGLASFTDAPQDEDEKPSLSRYRKKAKGESVDIQMRMTCSMGLGDSVCRFRRHQHEPTWLDRHF